MKSIQLGLVLILVIFRVCAQNAFTPVFVSGTEGYKSFRIPAIIGLKNGVLLAFAEGRVNSAGDFGNIDIVMKQSSDKGKTWGSIQVVAENETLQAGNLAPVVDLDDPNFPEGRIFLFYNTGNRPESEVMRGNGYKQ
jgi:sialidase-1